MAKRIMSIWLPQLPLDRFIRRADPRADGIFAITQDIKNAKRLTHISKAGLAAGLSVGMSLADARALAPDLLSAQENPTQTEHLLRAIRRWADGLSPWLSLDGHDGIVLDITGCAHLFGGEGKMRETALERLHDMHITAQIAIADTKGAAWAIARYAMTDFISPPGEILQSLSPLPVEALRIEPDIAVALRRVGLQTIGDLARIKSSDIARRYGLGTAQRLAKVLGHFPDPVCASPSDPVFAARMSLPEPIGLLDDVTHVLKRLARSVCARLARAGLGARRFVLSVRCVDTGAQKLTIGFARPTRNIDEIMRQYMRPLSDLKMAFGADWFRLLALDLEPHIPIQLTMDGQEEIEDGLDQVISTLGNRLGFDRIHRFAPQNSHIPERSFTFCEAAHTPALETWPTPQYPDFEPIERPRPLRIFRPERLRTITPGRPPQCFEWRKTRYQIHTANGPERLCAEWWQDRAEPVRDYWQVQTCEGPRLWLLSYPARTPAEWFVTGRFA